MAGADLERAQAYVRENGDPLALGRLEALLGGEPNADAIAALAEGQNEDGGWPATWSGEVSSLDATCYRLDHAVDLGDADPPVVPGHADDPAAAIVTVPVHHRDHLLPPRALRVGTHSLALDTPTGYGLWSSICGPFSPSFP